MPITTRNLLENNFDENDTYIDLSDFPSLVHEKAMERGWGKFLINTITNNINHIHTIEGLKFADIHFNKNSIIFDFPENEARELAEKMTTLLNTINNIAIKKTMNKNYADLKRIDFVNMQITDIIQILIFFGKTTTNRTRPTKLHEQVPGFTVSTDNIQNNTEITKYFDNNKNVTIENSNNNKSRPSTLLDWLMYFANLLRDFAVRTAKFITQSFTKISKSLYELIPSNFKTKYVGRVYKNEATEEENSDLLLDTSVGCFYLGFNNDSKQLSSLNKNQLPAGSAICNLLPDPVKETLGISYLIQAAFADYSIDSIITETEILNSVRNSVRLAKNNNVEHLLVTFIGSTTFLLKRVKVDIKELEKSEYVNNRYLKLSQDKNYSNEYRNELYEQVILQYLSHKIVETVRDELKKDGHQITHVSYFDYYTDNANAIYMNTYFNTAIAKAANKLENLTEKAYYSDPIVWLKTNEIRKCALITNRDVQLGEELALANLNNKLITGAILDIAKLLGDQKYKEFEANIAKRWNDIAITEEQANMLFSNTHKSIKTSQNAQMQNLSENNDLQSSLRNSP